MVSDVGGSRPVSYQRRRVARRVAADSGRRVTGVAVRRRSSTGVTMELHDDSLQNEAVLRCGGMNFITSSRAIPVRERAPTNNLGPAMIASRRWPPSLGCRDSPRLRRLKGGGQAADQSVGGRVRPEGRDHSAWPRRQPKRDRRGDRLSCLRQGKLRKRSHDPRRRRPGGGMSGRPFLS
jgi:hypothetical protein